MAKRKRQPRINSAGWIGGKFVVGGEELAGDKIPFQGEMMACILCDKTEQSNPELDSDWRCMELDNCRYYACPDHFPDDSPSKEGYEAAYRQFLVAAMKRYKDNPK